jgi:hypothetical protein
MHFRATLKPIGVQTIVSKVSSVFTQPIQVNTGELSSNRPHILLLPDPTLFSSNGLILFEAM